MQPCEQTKQQRQVAGVKSHQLNLGMVILATATSNHGHGNAHEQFTNHFFGISLSIMQESEKLKGFTEANVLRGKIP